MDKQLFDEAIGEPPPSTVDVDLVLARAQRTAWVRRVVDPWVVTGAGVVAVSLGAAALLAPGGGPELGVGPASSPVPGPAPASRVVPCAPTPTAPPTAESPEHAVTRLTAVLTAAVQRQLPGTAFEANPVAQYPTGTWHGPFAFYHVDREAVAEPDGGCSGGEDYFSARATTVTAGLRGNVSAVIGRLGGVATPTTECSADPVADADHTCERRTGPAGEVVVISTLTQRAGVMHRRVDVTKADGTGVVLQAENVGVDDKHGGTPESPAPPLTHEQLTVIALDPGLTLYP
jgi:hypothetical protein